MPEMVPAGFAADTLRFCYSSFAFIPSRGRWMRIRWFRLPADTPLVPGPYLYTSPVWDLRTDEYPGYGESGANRLQWELCTPPPWDNVLLHRLLFSVSASMVHAQIGHSVQSLKLAVDAETHTHHGIVGTAPLLLGSDALMVHSGGHVVAPALKLHFEGRGRHGHV